MHLTLCWFHEVLHCIQLFFQPVVSTLCWALTLVGLQDFPSDVTRRANSEFPGKTRHCVHQKTRRRDWPSHEETKCCSEAHWGSMLRGKSENYTATSSGITCWLAPWCNTWINRIYLIKLYSDERLYSARPHTLCNRGYIKTVNQQHNNWMSVARVCVWFSTFPPQLVYLFGICLLDLWHFLRLIRTCTLK